MLTTKQEYWFNWLNSYQDHRKINFTIGAVQKIAIKLGLSNFNIPVITVGGTNGKGSCVATIEACLSSLGYKVGSYTSPHMFSFTERIKINGKNIDELSVCNALQEVSDALSGEILSYFEMVTLASLLIFKSKKLDFLILEVGLGGRLDAVNVVQNNIAIIVSIGLEHTQYLGNTISQIAKEKAGIIKEHQSIIYAETNLEVGSLIKSIAQVKFANFYQLGQDFFTYTFPKIITSFPQENAIAGLMAIKLLDQKLIHAINFPLVFNNLMVPGRFQVIKFNGIDLIFDCAHNPPATKWLANKLGTINGKTVAIFSLSPEKDLENTLNPLLPIINEWLILPRLENIEFALKIVSFLKNTTSAKVQFFKQTSNAQEQIIEYILQNLSLGDRVVISGSFFTVAEFLPFFTTIPIVI